MNDPKSNTIRAVSLMLGIPVEALCKLLDTYDSEKKRTESGHPLGLPAGLGEAKWEAKVYNVDHGGSGSNSPIHENEGRTDAQQRED